MKASRAPLPKFSPETAWEDARNGNLGLWYDKHCDRWEENFSKLYDPTQRTRDAPAYLGGKLDWIKRAIVAASARLKDPSSCDQLKEFATRQRMFVEARRGRSFQAKAVTKFVSGLGRAHPVMNGFEWHHTCDVPVLRSSGQKGMVWDWVRTWEPATDAQRQRILGTPKFSGSVVFLPALPIYPPELSIDGTTPHLTEYYQKGEPPADWYSPVPLQWLAVAAGAVFQFAVIPAKSPLSGSPEDQKEQQDVATASAWLSEALAVIGTGAGTAIDRGLFETLEAPPASDRASRGV